MKIDVKKVVAQAVKREVRIKFDRLMTDEFISHSKQWVDFRASEWETIFNNRMDERLGQFWAKMENRIADLLAQSIVTEFRRSSPAPSARSKGKK